MELEEKMGMALAKAISFEKKGDSLAESKPHEAIMEFNKAIAEYFDPSLFPYPNCKSREIANLFRKKSNVFDKLSIECVNKSQEYSINSKVDKFVAQSFEVFATANKF